MKPCVNFIFKLGKTYVVKTVWEVAKKSPDENTSLKSEEHSLVFGLPLLTTSSASSFFVYRSFIFFLISNNELVFALLQSNIWTFCLPRVLLKIIPLFWAISVKFSVPALDQMMTSPVGVVNIESVFQQMITRSNYMWGFAEEK